MSSLLARLCALLLTVGALAAHAQQELPVYPGTVHTRIGNDLVIAGEYYRMAYFTTDDSLQKVADYFTRHWRSQGYPTSVDGDLENEAVVSALYTREGLQRGVVLRRHLGKTVGFTVLRDLWVSAPKNPSPGLVKVEGMLFTQDMSTRDAPGGSQNRSSLVKGSMEEVRLRVSQELGKQGYEPVRQAALKLGGETQLTLEHARKGEQVVTTLRPVEAGLTAMVQMWVGSDRPDAMPNNDAVRESRQAHERSKRTPQEGSK
ncbi:hypothetical protein [Pyxidicoccus trucidator]|uniref:hypothetical protein n=1 Tax=Pyxidicoccus trucidator TaxID=2709662 RepID=UPI0013D93A55|nr:hypothetical protein [Pyxidicoccus trucidator]